MRSAVLAGLVLLAGCDRTVQVPVADPTGASTESMASEAGQPVRKPPVRPNKPTTEIVTRDVSGVLVRAFGTEPFWSVEVYDWGLLYRTPELPDGQRVYASKSSTGKVQIHKGTLDGKAFVLTMEPGTCSDGMSDTVYDWKSSLTIDGKTELGCAEKL